MKLLTILVCAMLLCGCSAIAALVGDGAVRNEEPTTAKWGYQRVDSGPPGGSQVLIFGMSGALGGLHVTDYATLGHTIYVLPGTYTVAYACPGALVYSNDNTARVRVGRRRGQYFYCTGSGELAIGR